MIGDRKLITQLFPNDFSLKLHNFFTSSFFKYFEYRFQEIKFLYLAVQK
jgi:hypothetical protein